MLSPVQLFATPWNTAHQASLFFTIPWSLLKLMFTGPVMPFNHLILCHPLFFLLCLSQHQGIFQWVGSSYPLAKLLELQHHWSSFANIFSHSVDCLFILSVVSFAVQELLSLIRFHLFTFALGDRFKKILLWFMWKSVLPILFQEICGLGPSIH